MNTKITLDVQEKALNIISDFNSKVFKKGSGIEYYPVFKGDFLFLNRKEGKKNGLIARLKFQKKLTDWEFAIFKYSSECYDPDEYFFPGCQFIDGTIEGALKAGNLAYPPKWEPTDSALNSFINQVLGK